ncbi:hypothetical protein J6590_079250 [Homalodisca vitripennis]|nr:hypothetical protein J6590_079245 [Homalodisca vitripennis]KAG8290613.1 hypothetical protein J6590_079250 [Homalodisca vitripennis]
MDTVRYTTVATVGHGWVCVPGWPMWVIVGVVYLTTVGLGRIGVLRWPLWGMARSMYRDGYCESLLERCTTMDTVSYDRFGIPR